MNRKIVFILIAVVMVLMVNSDAEAKSGFYLGLGAAYNTIDGDLNGSGALLSDSDVIYLPDSNNAVGIDILTGYGINDWWAIELNLMSSAHRGRWGGLRGDVSYTSFSLNSKYSFSASSMTQPYLLLGISNNLLIFKKGARNTATGEVDDATLSGIGVNFGTGIDTYFTPQLSLTLGVMYRFVDYTEARGVDTSGTIDDSIDGSGFSIILTSAYHF
jgi:opacity protein-like surface antigen